MFIMILVQNWLVHYFMNHSFSPWFSVSLLGKNTYLLICGLFLEFIFEFWGTTIDHPYTMLNRAAYRPACGQPCSCSSYSRLTILLASISRPIVALSIGFTVGRPNFAVGCRLSILSISLFIGFSIHDPWISPVPSLLRRFSLLNPFFTPCSSKWTDHLSKGPRKSQLTWIDPLTLKSSFH